VGGVDELPTPFYAEFAVRVPQVGLHGVHRQEKLLGDLVVGLSVPGEPGDGRFLGCEGAGRGGS
jgi:hypothetical protein